MFKPIVFALFAFFVNQAFAHDAIKIESCDEEVKKCSKNKIKKDKNAKNINSNKTLLKCAAGVGTVALAAGVICGAIYFAPQAGSGKDQQKAYSNIKSALPLLQIINYFNPAYVDNEVGENFAGIKLYELKGYSDVGLKNNEFSLGYYVECRYNQSGRDPLNWHFCFIENKKLIGLGYQYACLQDPRPCFLSIEKLNLHTLKCATNPRPLFEGIKILSLDDDLVLPPQAQIKPYNIEGFNNFNIDGVRWQIPGSYIGYPNWANKTIAFLCNLKKSNCSELVKELLVTILRHVQVDIISSISYQFAGLVRGDNFTMIRDAVNYDKIFDQDRNYWLTV
jgi:hypothetical protein